MRKYYAHSGTGSTPSSDWQLLADHLQQVADLCRRFARSAKPDDNVFAKTAEAAGLLHDLGKYQDEWQDYLLAMVRGEDPEMVPHAIHGAALGFFQLHNLALTFSVMGHHAGLKDWSKDVRTHLFSQQTDLEKTFVDIRSTVEKELPTFPKNVEPPFPIGKEEAVRHRYEFWIRMVFSVLIDADRLDTEKHYTKVDRSSPALDADRLLRCLDDKREEHAKKRPDDPLTRLRNRVFADCVSAGNKDRGFFSLTVPTGGGKTFSAMAFALAHAKKHALRRVIVVIPYLSIIEQNASVYKGVFGEDVVLEHHSAMSGNEEAETPRRTWAELATENWDAPIIVTTSVQFLESLLACKTRRCRKLHNIARSVVVFDEAQTLPTHILNPILSVFHELVDHFGVSMVFSTATQPAFRRTSKLDCGFDDAQLCSILSNELEARLFTELQRVEYHPELEEPQNWETIATRLRQSRQGLCVVNTRAHARELYNALRDQLDEEEKQAVFHLSSSMCAEHRMAVLGDPANPEVGSIRYRLQHKQPCWLISTQVIEAGVDVDFPVVYRALGPLDSIVQVAGRCNREGLLTDETTGEPRRGDVYIFEPEDNTLPLGVYQQATGLTTTILGEVEPHELATRADVFRRYFHELYSRLAVDNNTKGDTSIQEDRAKFRFAEVAKKSTVIPQDGESVLVPYGDAIDKIDAIRKKSRPSRRDLRSLQRFTVNLRSSDIRKLEGLLTFLKGTDGPRVLHSSAYDSNLGVIVGGCPTEDFIV